MKINKIADESGGSYIMIPSPEVEKVNPIEYYSNYHIQKSVFLGRELLMLYKIPLLDGFLDKFLFKTAKDEWNEQYKEIMNVSIPNNLKEILNTKRKNEQLQLLRNMTITTEQLFAFIFHAWNEGFSFSQYKAEHHHKGVNEDDLPAMINVEGDEIKTIGKTTLTKGEQKQVIENRKVIIAKFFDKEDEWHCFFVTYDSLKGKESWQGGQAHLHYISDKFGLKREEVVKQLKSGKYSLGSPPHINLTDYGNQPQKS